jgi:exodeoxyribonuclease VII small subunit
MKKDLSFDQAWKALERLLGQIESEALPLDQLAGKVKEAQKLIGICEDKLRAVQKAVAKTEKQAGRGDGNGG